MHKMKKLIAIILTLCTVLSICGCGESAEQGSSSAPETKTATSSSAKAQPKAEQTSSISTVVVPDVVGMDKDEAVKKLEDLGLKVVIAEEPLRNTDQKDNTITMQSRDSGTVVVSGTDIELQYNTHEFSFCYFLNEKTQEYSVQYCWGLLNESETSLSISPTYNELPVTMIEHLPRSFEKFGAQIKTLYIPESIKTINFGEHPVEYKVVVNNSESNVSILDAPENIDFLQ